MRCHRHVRKLRSRHRYFEQGKPLLSLSSHGARRERKPDESHTNDTGGQPRNASVSPGTWTEPGPAPVLTPVLSSREAGLSPEGRDGLGPLIRAAPSERFLVVASRRAIFSAAGRKRPGRAGDAR